MSIEHDILQTYSVIAVVGLSSDPARPSHRISRYMQEHGYRIIPINPDEAEVLGEPSYPSLAAVPERVEFVNVFRRPQFCGQIAREAVEAGAKALWLQLGIRSDEARAVAEQAGIAYVEDECVMVVHRAEIA